jgi:hypothetical protein
MRWRVQLGINSTSDVWKFCQNWTSRRGEFIISMTKLDTYFSMSTSYSLAKAQSCQTLNQNLVLLFVSSFNSFVQAKFGAFVRIFIYRVSQKKVLLFDL